MTPAWTYMADNATSRAHPGSVLEGVRSVVMRQHRLWTE